MPTSTGHQQFAEQPPPSPSAERSNRSAGVKRKNGSTAAGRQRKVPKRTQAMAPPATTAGIGPSIRHGETNAPPPTEQPTLPSSVVPPSYVARDPTTNKASQDLKDLATGASNCWIHIRGVNEADLPSDPQPIEEAKQDGARRVKGLPPKTYIVQTINTQMLGDNSPDSVTGEEVTSEGLARYIAELIADQDLRLLCYVGQGNIRASDIPERRIVARVTSDLSQKEKEQLKEDMKRSKGRVSLTSDLWTDVMERPFMAVTGHFINAMKKSITALMAFRIVEGAHAGTVLAQHIFAVLKEYDIVHKVGSITLDNASNNNTMMEELTRLIRAEGYDFDKEGNRIRCFPHIINLAVTAFLDALDLTGDYYLDDRNASDHPPTEKTENYVLA
ncbi:hypothetical protein RSOL_496520, partial [Rhizoctonia solani AG-3 Rhs1AP]